MQRQTNMLKLLVEFRFKLLTISGALSPIMAPVNIQYENSLLFLVENKCWHERKS